MIERYFGTMMVLVNHRGWHWMNDRRWYWKRDETKLSGLVIESAITCVMCAQKIFV